MASARAKALAVVGEHHPLKDDVLLIVSELVTNAVVHAGRGPAGAKVRLRLAATRDLLIVEVYDRGSLLDVPRITEAPGAGEGGRGLFMVQCLCGGRWGTALLGGARGRLVWAALPQTNRAPSAAEIMRRRQVA